MLRPLPPDLFAQGEPLRAASWNALVDASEELVDVWGGEHVDGRQHASARLESAAIGLMWDGADWWPMDEDRLHVVQSISLGDRSEVQLEFSEPLWGSRQDYAVLAQGNNGCPCIVPSPSKTPEGFHLVVPAGSDTLTEVAVVVIGRERVSE